MRKRDEITADLKITQDAVEGFFQTLGEQNVPPERLTGKLVEIASQFEEARLHLAPLDPDDPATKALADQARVELDKGHPDAAAALLQRAEEAELAAAAQARTLAQQATAAADARRLQTAKAREGRGDVALIQLRYAEAAGHFGAAFGERESGTARLEEAVTAYRAALEEYTRDRVPLDWATTQTNLGTALSRLGQRESGTARLEEAVAAYRVVE